MLSKQRQRAEVAQAERHVAEFVEAAELVLPELEDLKLFRKYYRHCLHFADPTVPTLPLAAAR